MIHVFSYDNLKSLRQLYMEIGLQLDAQGKYEKAIENFRAAINQPAGISDLKYDEIAIALGNALLKHGAHAEAMKTFLDAAVQTNAQASEYFEVLLNEVSDEFNASDLSAISEWLNEIWKPRLESFVLSEEMKIALDICRAKIYSLQDQMQEAALLLKEILQKFPHNSRACRGLAEIYFQQQHYPLAEEYFHNALSAVEKNSLQHVDISMALVRTFIADSKFEQAKNSLEELQPFVTDELKTSISYLKAKSLFGLKLYADANMLLDELIQQYPKNILYQIDRIVNQIALHDYAKALTFIDQAFQIDPVNDELLFLKIECLIEGGLGIQEGVRLFSGSSFSYLKMKGNQECEQKINTIRAQRPDDENANIFITFIQLLIDGESDQVNELVAKIQEVTQSSNNEYPKLGLFILKAEMSEKSGKMIDAASNYLEAGKCYYWMGDFSTAENYFRKVLSLNPEFTEAYYYLADTLYLLSQLTLPPYNDIRKINEALEILNQAPDKIVHDKNTAWFYIVIARIHELMYKFAEENSLDEYWKAVLYTERALIHDPTNTSYWYNLARYYRNLEVEENSRFVFDKEARNNEENAVFKEEHMMLLIDAGDFAEPEMYLQELEHGSADKNNATTFLWYHKAWKGFIMFHQDIANLPHCLQLFDEVLRENDTELFAHMMKMFCHWQLQENEQAILEANKIRSFNVSDYPKENFVFSWAAFIAGFVEEAIQIMQQFVERNGLTRSASFSLLQFYILDGQEAKAETYFEHFIQFVDNKKVVLELMRSLDQLHHHSQQSNYENVRLVVEQNIATWKVRLEDKLKHILTKPTDLIQELKNKQLEFQFKEGSIPDIAIKAGIARLIRENDVVASNKIYSSLRKFQSEFPEAELMVANFWSELTNKGINFNADINPVVLEISNNLIPEGDSSRWSLFTTYIPDLRNRINQEFGLSLAGVRIWPSEFLQDNSYIIMLDEVPMVQGFVERDKLVVIEDQERLKSAGILVDKSHLVLNNLSLHWIDQAHKESLTAQQITFDEDYFSFMITHLEILLRSNLDLLVDIQFSENYVSENLEFVNLKDNYNIKLQAERIRNDDDLLRKFNSVLKGLLHEAVPVINKAIIIGCFMGSIERTGDVNEIIQTVRIALKNELPGNVNNLPKVNLPDNIEEALLTDLLHVNGVTFLSMKPEDCQQQLNEINSLVLQSSGTGNCIVIVNDSKLRIHLQKMLELGGQKHMVMCREELIIN